MNDTDIRVTKAIPAPSDESSVSIPADTVVVAAEPVKQEDANELYESLQSKKQLFKMLESQGYLNKSEAAPIEQEIERALADLEEIIGMC